MSWSFFTLPPSFLLHDHLTYVDWGYQSHSKTLERCRHLWHNNSQKIHKNLIGISYCWERQIRLIGPLENFEDWFLPLMFTIILIILYKPSPLMSVHCFRALFLRLLERGFPAVFMRSPEHHIKSSRQGVRGRKGRSNQVSWAQDPLFSVGNGTTTTWDFETLCSNQGSQNC